MRNLPVPSRNSVRADLIKAIRQYPYKGQILGHLITEAEINEMIALYDFYDAHNGRPDDHLKGAAFPQSLRDAVYKAYDTTQVGKRMQSIRELVMAGVSQCPICGIGPPGELDHHLPRSHFKPLAIYPRNLVPMCHDCNHKKSAAVGEDQEDTGFLSAYFDVLPAVDFLRAQVQMINGGLLVDFTIDDIDELPAGYRNRLLGQLDTLKLNTRYESEINKCLSGLAVSMHLEFGRDGAQGVRNLLLRQARFDVDTLHRNHWRPVLLKALAASNEFIDGGFAQVFPVAPEILQDAIGA